MVFKSALFSSPLPSIVVVLKTNSFPAIVSMKTSSLEADAGKKKKSVMGLELPPKPHT